MKIYTKTGDKGTTSLVYGKRISKSDPRVEAYGTTDECNAFIGLAVSELRREPTNETFESIIRLLEKVQTTIFHAGAELSTPLDKEVQWKLTEDDITALETVIDTFQEQLAPLKQFILPGGSVASAHLHVARTIARRAERLCVDIEQVSPIVLAYLNRLSDFLFVVARMVNQQLSVAEPILIPRKKPLE